MSSTYSRPSFRRQGLVFLVLLSVVAYGAYHMLVGENGVYAAVGLQNDKALIEQELKTVKSAQAKYRHLLDLYKPHQLDPDIIEEQARALLMMANAQDLLVLDSVKTAQ